MADTAGCCSFAKLVSGQEIFWWKIIIQRRYFLVLGNSQHLWWWRQQIMFYMCVPVPLTRCVLHEGSWLARRSRTWTESCSLTACRWAVPPTTVRWSCTRPGRGRRWRSPRRMCTQRGRWNASLSDARLRGVGRAAQDTPVCWKTGGLVVTLYIVSGQTPKSSHK